MSKVKLGDIVCRIKDLVDKDNTDLIYYIGGEHFDNRSLTVTRKGIIKGSTIGPAFSTKFKAGDVLLMSRNPHLRKAGIVNFDGICSDVSYIIRTRDENVIMQKFIPILFQSDIFWEFAEKNKKGSTNFFLNWSDFERFEFDLPDIETQQKLCDELWAINDTIDSYKEMIKQSDELIKAKFVEMFGDIGTDPFNFGFAKLSKCAEINPKKPSNVDDDLLVSFVAMPSVSECGKIDTNILKKYKDVKKGFTYFSEKDVLFAKITPCMENGKGCVAINLSNNIGFGSTEFHVLRPIKNISNPYWLYELTMLDKFRVLAKKNMTGTGGQLRVPISFINNFEIALPPIEKQNLFEVFYLDLKKSILQFVRSINKLQKIYNLIIEKYFTNEEE